MSHKSRNKSSKKSTNPPSRSSAHHIRRVLAERVSGLGEPEYLVDWFSTWESKPNRRNSLTIALEEWSEMKARDTFQLGNDTVVRCINSSADDSPKHTLLMRETVFEHFQNRVLEGDPQATAHFLFRDDDWIFESDKHRGTAEDVASNNGETSPTAAEILRRTYVSIRANPPASRYHIKPQDETLPYLDIKVTYIGQVDPEVTTAPDTETRTARDVKSLLFPLFDGEFHELQTKVWEVNTAHSIALHLSRAIEDIPTLAPYLLGDPLLHMFVRLFFTADELKASLDKVGIEVGEDWHDHSRDLFLWTYCRTNTWERRPVDCVERTYMATRDEVRDFVRNNYDENGYLIVAEHEDGDDKDGVGDVQVKKEKDEDDMDVEG